MAPLYFKYGTQGPSLPGTWVPLSSFISLPLFFPSSLSSAVCATTLDSRPWTLACMTRMLPDVPASLPPSSDCWTPTSHSNFTLMPHLLRGLCAIPKHSQSTEWFDCKYMSSVAIHLLKQRSLFFYITILGLFYMYCFVASHFLLSFSRLSYSGLILLIQPFWEELILLTSIIT